MTMRKSLAVYLIQHFLENFKPAQTKVLSNPWFRGVLARMQNYRGIELQGWHLKVDFKFCHAFLMGDKFCRP